MWLTLCAPDDLPWNTEPRGLNTEDAPAGLKLGQACLESPLALCSALSSRWLWCLLSLLQAQKSRWPWTPHSHAHLRFPPLPFSHSLNPPLSPCMTSSPGSCLHHLHIPCCSEISQVTRPEGEGNTGLSAQCHTFCTEKTTPWAPCSGLPPVKVGSLFLGATRGCREWVCTAQVETSLGCWGETLGFCFRVSNLPSKSCFRG